MTVKKAIIYVHGKGGNADESKRYERLCKGYEVYGLDYKGNTPWDTEQEFQKAYDELSEKYEKILIIANSIGAYFTMNALARKKITKALFISPVVDMEKLILDMLSWANTDERELCEKGEITTAFGEVLSWEYLQYVRSNPIIWNVPTDVLYADKDNLTSIETVTRFVTSHNATLSVMQNGEHWFHTKEQLDFLDKWVTEVFKDTEILI